MISKRSHHQRITSIFDHLNDGVIKRILVLFQPSSQVVRHSGGIVNDCKVCIGVWSWVGLGKLGPFSKHVGHQLLSKGFVSCFWEKGFFFKDSQEGHWLLKHVNTFLEIHAKVHISPIKTFFYIFLLLRCEHVLVKELLQLLIYIINANLLKTIVVEDLKPCNVKDTNICDLFHGWITKGFVTLLDYKAERAFIDATSNTGDRACSSSTSGTFLDPFSTDLQLGLAEVGDHPFTVNATKTGNFLSIYIIFDFSLFFFAHRYKILGHVTHVHESCSAFEDIVLLVLSEAKNVKSLISKLHVFLVVDAWYGQLSLADEPVVQDII